MGDFSKDFKVLNSGCIYFDNAATSLTPNPVIEAISEYYFTSGANIMRGVHRSMVEASHIYQDARRLVAEFINASEDEIVFCRNTTEAINLIAYGLQWNPGDKIVTTMMEHHSNFLPWLRVNQIHSVELEIIKPGIDGRFDLSDFKRSVDHRTKLVAIGHVSNVLGCINPVEDVAQLAQQNGALLLLDAAQSVPHLKIDVNYLNCDFLAASGHKMLGPTGIGFLFLKDSVRDRISPFNLGGGTIEDVRPDGFKLKTTSERFEGGTPNIAGAIGLAAAIEYIRHIGFDRIKNETQTLFEKLTEGLKKRAYVSILGDTTNPDRTSLVSFNIEPYRPHRVASMLDELGKFQVRSGHHCALPLLRNVFNLPYGSVRASLYFYNTVDEINQFFEVLDFIGQNT